MGTIIFLIVSPFAVFSFAAIHVNQPPVFGKQQTSFPDGIHDLERYEFDTTREEFVSGEASVDTWKEDGGDDGGGGGIGGTSLGDGTLSVGGRSGAPDQVDYNRNSSDSAAIENVTNSDNPANNISDVIVSPSELVGNSGISRDEEIQSMHVETLKSRILSKLRLSSPPVLNGVVPELPLDVLQREYIKDGPYHPNSMLSNPTDFYARTKQIVILAKDETTRCNSGKNIVCLRFNLTKDLSYDQIHSVDLWLYKLYHIRDPNIQTFTVSELGKEPLETSLRPRNMIGRIETGVRSGWVKVNIKGTFLKWLKKPWKNNGIAVVCSDCRHRHNSVFSRKKGTSPFVTINVRKSRFRQVRNPPMMCRERTSVCCLKPLTINFEDIGWDGVIHPASFQANYCRGSCHAPHMAHSNHSQVVQDHRWNSDERGALRQLTPCCSPTSYEHLSVVFMRENKIEIARIPNIIATSCGCL